MPGERLYREFQNLERKIQLMVSENRRLKQELEHAQGENKNLLQQLEGKHATLNSVQEQLKINKLANNMVVGAEGSEEMKQMIEGYIKEIDKCIAHLAE